MNKEALKRAKYLEVLLVDVDSLLACDRLHVHMSGDSASPINRTDQLAKELSESIKQVLQKYKLKFEQELKDL